MFGMPAVYQKGLVILKVLRWWASIYKWGPCWETYSFEGSFRDELSLEWSWRARVSSLWEMKEFGFREYVSASSSEK